MFSKLTSDHVSVKSQKTEANGSNFDRGELTPNPGRLGVIIPMIRRKNTVATRGGVSGILECSPGASSAS